MIRGIRYERARVHIEDAKGVRNRKIIYGKTKAELERKVKAALATPARTAEASKMTVEAYFVDRFLPGAKSTIAPATYASYKNAVDTRIVPGIGKARFASLQPDNVRAWIAEMTDEGEGARADQIAVAILKRGYNRAVEDGLLASSPVSHVKLPKAEMREQYILDLKETIHFLRTVRLSNADAKWFPLMYCAVSLGMRESELFGLRWDKVNMISHRVRILEQSGPLSDGKTLGQVVLKTPSSKRTLYLDPATERVLKIQIGKDRHFVFPNA
jgi:integrase